MAVGDLRKIDARSQVKHTRHWLWYISAISFVTGALLATSIRTQKVIGKEFADRGVSFRPNALGERLKAAWGEIKDQREMIAQKNVEIASLLNQLKDQEPNTRKIIEEIEGY